MYKLVDFVTKKPVKPAKGDLVFTGKSTPWEIVMDLKRIQTKMNKDYFKVAPPCLTKYLPFLPVESSAEFVSLRETATPLIKSKNLSQLLGLDLYFKIEGKNPTGSFKDRGSAVEISVAKELGAKAVILASTGNMAASCACYAAAAKMPCYVLVPEGVPSAKLSQVIAFGGHIVQVKGTYNDAAKLAEKIARRMGFYLAGDYAYRVEGQKTAAFEICDQLFYEAPDWVVVPIGCGTNIAAYKKGFEEYAQLGLIAKVPKIFGVEAEGADAVVRSFQDKSHQITPLDSVNTIASAIAVPNPIDGLKALDAVIKTGGRMESVSDQEILKAQYLLSVQEGLFVESASAATLAALIKTDKKLFKNQKIVCVLTGDGLKEASQILKTAIKPPAIHPDEKEFLNLYHQHFFKSQSMVFVDKNKIVFKTSPTLLQIKKQLKLLFNAQYHHEYCLKIKHILDKILQKGKTITVSDFQDSIQDALETLSEKTQSVFSVVDFEVMTGKDRKPCAQVKVQIDKEFYEAAAEGVGPVDALINALRIACSNKIDFKLMDYKVEIRNQGVDAVVYVELKLAKNNIYSLGRATSPDIIQASIEAFQEAYNGFC